MAQGAPHKISIDPIEGLETLPQREAKQAEELAAGIAAADQRAADTAARPSIDKAALARVKSELAGVADALGRTRLGGLHHTGEQLRALAVQSLDLAGVSEEGQKAIVAAATEMADQFHETSNLARASEHGRLAAIQIASSGGFSVEPPKDERSTAEVVASIPR